MTFFAGSLRVSYFIYSWRGCWRKKYDFMLIELLQNCSVIGCYDEQKNMLIRLMQYCLVVGYNGDSLTNQIPKGIQG